MLKICRILHTLAMLAVALTSMPVKAQDFHSDQNAASTPSPTKMQLWCLVTDPESNRLFVSDPVPTSALSRMALWNASSRFVTVVNSRYNLTIRNSDHACSIYRDKTHATKARSTMVSLAQHHGGRIVTVGLD